MGKVIDITASTPHTVAEVMCWKCGRRFVSVAPSSVLLKDLQCPDGHIGYCFYTGQDVVTE